MFDVQVYVFFVPLHPIILTNGRDTKGPRFVVAACDYRVGVQKRAPQKNVPVKRLGLINTL
jgi:hypothetical protein